MTRARLAFWIGQLAFCVAVVLLCLYAYRHLLVCLPPLHADEAGHALPAARMALALGNGDLHGFLDAIWREALWPFFHPLFIAAFFMIFDISSEVARASSLLTFAAAVCLLPAFVRGIHSRDGAGGAPLAAHATLGWLSAAALATASLWGLGCTVMTESLGMLVTLVALGADVRASRQVALMPHFVCGALAAVAFFTKYNYGLPLIGALVVAQAWRARDRGARPLVALGLGMALPIAAWTAFMLTPDWRRVHDFVRFVVNRDEGLHGLAGLLFYPRALGDQIGWAAGLVTVLGLLGATLHRPFGARLSPALFVLLTLTQLTMHPNKQARYLVPALPVLLALAETELAWWLGRLRGRTLVWAAAALALVVARNPLAQIRGTAAGTDALAPAWTILGFVSEHVPREGPLLVLGSSGLLPHLALTWELLERERREREVDLLLFPDDAGWDPRYRTGYPAGMLPEYAPTLHRTLASGRYGCVVTLKLGPHSPFLPDWMSRWDAWAQNYVRLMEEQTTYLVAAESRFPESDATVRIYTKRGLR